MTDIASPPSGSTELAAIETNAKWIRGRLGDRTVIDTTDALFVWEHRYYPQWYVPVVDVAGELRQTGEVTETDNRGAAHTVDLVVADGDGGETVIPDAGRIHPDSPVPELRNRVRFRWEALDRWFEEDVEVFVHPRSPYTRVDVLPSTRHVVVRVDGPDEPVVVAESNRASILYETGLPPRYYLPPDDVHMDLLVPTETSSACPYKGVARYWSVEVDGVDHPDVAWGYDEPLPESAGVQGLICFYNERVDLTIDGEAVARPNTKFS
ncbi:MAG: DUF427 domain-containing protein [Actinomycetota bacterium]